MDQAKIYLGLLQDTNITNGVYGQKSAGFRVVHSKMPLWECDNILQRFAALRAGVTPTEWSKHHQLPTCDRRATLSRGGMLYCAARILHPGERCRSDRPQAHRCGSSHRRKFQCRLGISRRQQTRQDDSGSDGNIGT